MAGLIFHESRVGSTLVANMLGADSANIVYSESPAPNAVALNCHGCTAAQQTRWLRAVVAAMGLTAVSAHRRVFLKLQSANTPQLALWRRAFPDVPWVFLFREPVETMQSYFNQIGHAHSFEAMVPKWLQDAHGGAPEPLCARKTPSALSRWLLVRLDRASRRATQRGSRQSSVTSDFSSGPGSEEEMCSDVGSDEWIRAEMAATTEQKCGVYLLSLCASALHAAQREGPVGAVLCRRAAVRSCPDASPQGWRGWRRAASAYL